MSRLNRGGYGHHIRYLGTVTGHAYYEISWTWDRYLKGRNWRHPTTIYRDTDAAGARRFAKKWGIDPPQPTEDQP